MTTSTVDWLTFRTRATPWHIRAALTEAAGQPASLDLVGRGWKGYEDSGPLRFGDMRVGLWGTGGHAQRGWSTVQIDSHGCDWLRDWDRSQEALANLSDYQARRVDLAVDTHRGELSHELVVQAHKDGGFTTRGRPPNLRRIESWPRSDGWTCEIGKRENGLFARGYEKGFEQCKRYGLDPEVHQEIDGHAVKDWYRFELELKAKKDPLPMDLIDKRDEYFAGAYPFTRELIACEPFQLRAAREVRPQRDLAQVLGHIQSQYGRSLFTALVAYQGDIGAVWQRIVGTEHSQALVDAGVLMVDHD